MAGACTGFAGRTTERKLSAKATRMIVGGTSRIMATITASWAWIALGCAIEAIATAIEKQ